MTELTPDVIAYTHSLLGAHPDDAARPGDVTSTGIKPGAAPPASAPPFTFSPTKPPVINLNTDPKLLQAGLDAADEARAWVKTSLRHNRLGRVPGVDADGDKGQVMFNHKATALKIAIDTVVAGGRMANLKSGDIGRRVITADFVAGLITEALANAPAVDPNDPAGKKDDDDDGPEAHVEVTPKGAETQVQFTINLRVVNDKNPNQILWLQSVDVTLHLGKDADNSSIEAQLNIVKIKSDITNHVRVNGHVLVDSIEFTAGVSAEANMTKAALLQLQGSIEVKLKAELEFKITKYLSFSIEADGGRDGATVGPKFTIRF